MSILARRAIHKYEDARNIRQSAHDLSPLIAYGRYMNLSVTAIMCISDHKRGESQHLSYRDIIQGIPFKIEFTIRLRNAFLML